MSTHHFTAWLTNDPTALDQPNMDITVLRDELIGDPADGDAAWSSAGDPLYYAVTDMSARDFEGNPLPTAEAILTAAGWARVGEWDAVPTGYVLTVAPAESDQ